MDPLASRKLLAIAENAARQAGKYLLETGARDRRVDSFSGKDVKLQADRQSEKIIINLLRSKTNFLILSEERGLEKGNRDYRWIVDPLDGSLNYLRGIPLCCVSIALWDKKKPILGVIYDFNRSQIYSGITTQKAWLNDREIETSCVSQKDQAVLCTGFPLNTSFRTKDLMRFVTKIQDYKKVRLLGSAALSLAYVACGKADEYTEDNIMLWDVAAGLAIVSAAGGRYDMVSGLKHHSVTVSATNGVL